MSLPTYVWRRHPRSRRLRLRICAARGLSVTTPYHTTRYELESWLESQKPWIAKHQDLLDKFAARTHLGKPNNLYLPALKQYIGLHYEEGLVNKWDWLCKTQLHITSTGAGDAVYPILKDFLQNLSRHTLIPLLKDLSLQKELPFESARVGWQSSLWGSCNSRKQISLNAKLLFLPSHLCQHVLLHELVHTQILDHGAAFWSTLTQLDPLTAFHRKQLREANRYLPDWVQ